MADPQQSPAPLTDSLRSDVLLLSSYLSGTQCSSSVPRPRDKSLRPFLDISTLLAIGNTHSPEAQNVNAVIGSTNQKAESVTLELLVCVENARQDIASVAEIKGAPNGNFSMGGKKKLGVGATENALVGGGSTEIVGDKEPLVHITPDMDNGRKLLEVWDGQSSDKEWNEIKNDFAFDEHLRDLFDVITCLNPADPADYARFHFFIHHRAYRKLAWRVLEFSTHWGESPFDILSNHLDTTMESNDFHFFDQNERFHQYVQRYVEVNADGSYLVSSDNAHNWLELFKCLWLELENELLVSKSEENPTKLTLRTDSPNLISTKRIVFRTIALEALMPVFKHLSSAQMVRHALAKAELDQYLLSISKTSDNMSLERIAISRDDDDDDGPISILDYSGVLSNPDQSVDRLVQAMKTVLAWQSACSHIFEQANLFQRTPVAWQLSQFRYPVHALKATRFNVDTVSILLQEWEELSGKGSGPKEVSQLISRTLTAKVHAEAALMHWIATEKDPESTKEWPIGVSKKSCQLCWSLKDAYNRKRPFKFVLPGTHGTFYPWLPPPGLPDDILVALRQELLEACKKVVRTHSRQSSAGSATGVRVIPDRFFEGT